ncbi:NADH-quinone oxidoreductase subunit N [Oceanidesulfovibrio marinus]|uniref:NADH-quinone oxidoreductase subunit N n=1 Tax=Oceanidesulfovibrio marinus TaxID=370038 RepID=A0A6P1ZH98_9BACT|nr:NADH-quinone oxidoreductase subunit N [Oceanidesulfovibrio marinus]TVM33758.1 NADH-quinone oxidoreductase subunit N [Oceanidesulfovibrio marinus]
MNDILIFSPHLVLTLGILLCFGLGVVFKWPRGLYAITLCVTILAGTMALLAYPGPPPVNTGLRSMLATGPLSAYFLPLLCALSTVILLLFGPYLKREGHAHEDELYALFLSALLGGLLLAGGRSWLAFFLGLELLSLPLYVLIALRKTDAGGNEASMKYFAMGATASAVLLFGIALIYAGSGTLDIAASLGQPEGAATVLLGLGMVIAGLAFKLSIAPFHLWAPDVYRGAPAPVAALLTSSVKAAAAAGLLRIALAMSPPLVMDPPLWPATVPMLWALAALTMLAANLAALVQTSVKRMLGFSSAAHMGYMLMGILCVREAGPGPVMYYAAALAVMDLGAFGALTLLDSQKDVAVDSLDSLHGLGRARPWAAALLAISLAALAGLPPTAGFTGKLLLFRATLVGGYDWLAFIGIAGAAVSVFYYLRALAALYIEDTRTNYAAERLIVSSGVAVFLVMVALIGLGLLPSPVLHAATPLHP